ncbi:hypothetical protein DFH09DRAFT_1164709 [Mycena vulgaris]|nr:hypothetical protein DFH09DRAFT_1164709 [Mycena vulgaris]
MSQEAPQASSHAVPQGASASEASSPPKVPIGEYSKNERVDEVILLLILIAVNFLISTQEVIIAPKNVENLSKKRDVNISIASVAYLKCEEPQDILPWVAILLELSFNMPKLVEARVDFSMTLQDPSGGSSSQLQLPFIYPFGQEMVRVTRDGRHVETTSVFNPHVSVPMAFGSVAVEAGSITRHDTHEKNPHISRIGTKHNNSSAKTVQMGWTFNNYNNTFYPASHSLIVLIRGRPESKDQVPPFTFNIRIARAKVKVDKYFGDFSVETLERDSNWEFKIGGNYLPNKVDEVLQEYKAGRAKIRLVDLSKNCVVSV